MNAARRARRGAALLLVVTGAACAPAGPERSSEEVGTATSPLNLLLTDADKLDPGGAPTGLGVAVALSGDATVGALPVPERVLVGAPPPFGGVNPGDAFVFGHDASGWSPEDPLNVVGGLATDAFGGAVALSGDTAIVGAAGDGVSGSSGAAHVFVREGGTWSLQQTLTASMAEPAEPAEAKELFGGAVALWGDMAFVAARSRDHSASIDDSGAVFVFVRSGGIWDWKQTLSPMEPVSKEHFGVSVSVSGDPGAALPDTLVVGANGHMDGQVKTGAVYVYAREGADWEPKEIVLPPPALVDSSFGRTAVVAGDVLVVGAHTYSTAAAPQVDAGAAVVFERQNGSFVGVPMDLIPDDGTTYQGLGVSAALANGRIFVGAGRDGSSGTAQNGAVYVFSKGARGWKPETVITIATLGSSDLFGRAVAAWGDTVAAGAPGANGGSGAVYVTVLPHQDGVSCSAAGDCLSGHCVDSVCCDTACDGAGEACSAAAKGSGVDGVCDAVGATTASGSGGGTGVTGMGGNGAGGTGMGAGGTSGSGTTTTSGGGTTTTGSDTTTSGSGTTTTGSDATTDGVGAGGSGGTGTGAGAGTSSTGGTGGGTGGVSAETSYYACAAAPGRPASSSLLAAGTLAIALLRRSRRKRSASR